MNTKRTREALFVLMAMGIFIITACVPESPTSPPLIFRNGLVITATSDDPIPNGVVVIEDGLITAVGPESDVTIPENATSIDIEGKTIMPGLIDAHIHILDKLEMEDGSLIDWQVELYLKKTIAAGITTFRDVGSHWGNSESISDLRASLEVYGNTIPRIVMTGPFIAHAQDAVFIESYSALSGYPVSNVEEAREAAESFIENGADQTKILLYDNSEISLDQEQVRAIVDITHQKGIIITAHATRIQDAEMVLAEGVDELAHWPSIKSSPEPVPDELLRTLVDEEIPVVSTFNVTPAHESDARRFLDAGGILVFGSDAPGTGQIENTRREFSFMVLQEMTPLEMIQSATYNAAIALGIGDQVGTLEVGKQADIIVIDGNLLEDNFLNTIEKVIYVVNNGELVVKPE